MRYGFYLGPSGAGKTYKLIQDVIDRSLEDKDTEFLIVVPDQYTMATQKKVVEMHPAKGIMNIDVLSFGRLYHRMTAECGEPTEVLLDDTGKNLMIRRAIQGMEGELASIGSFVNRQGYIHEIKSVISEFMQYGYGPDDVDEIINAADKKPALKGRLKDLQKIYRRFNEYRAGKFMATEEKNSILANAISENGFIKDTVIFFDGFTGFTPVQMQVLGAMFLNCREMWFAFTIDKESLSDSYEGELFAMTKETVAGINSLAKSLKDEREIVKAEDIWLCRDENGNCRRFENNAIAHLERNIFRKKTEKTDDEARGIFISPSENPRDELMSVCEKIREITSSGNALYRDIAIVTGDLQTYSLYAKECFDKYGIPYFTDSSESVGVNPFIDFVKGGLKVTERDFSYDTVMSLLRTGMTELSHEEIDILDNYLYATGIRGYSSYKKEFRRIPDYLKFINKDTGKKEISPMGIEVIGRINSIREKVIHTMDTLVPFLSGKHKATDITKGFYEFIKNNKAYENLCEYVSYFEEEKDTKREKTYRQIFGKVMELLDVLYSLLGEDELTIREYLEVFEAGLEEIKISTIPITVDYVLLGDIERSRIGDVKYLFFIGVNDGIIPAATVKGGLISDTDREYLSGNGDITLAPSPKQKMYSQRLYLYMNMTKPSTGLYITYSCADQEGKAKRPSYLISRIEKLFPGITESRENGNRLGNTDGLFAKLADDMRKYAAGFMPLNEIREFYLYCLNADREKTEKIVSCAFKKYECDDLTKEQVKLLYGDEQRGSVTRLETFAVCACKHFLRYGMLITGRETPDLEAYDNGNLMHNTLKRFSDSLKEKGLSWRDVKDDDIDENLSKAFDDELLSGGESKYDLNNVNRYERDRVKKILDITVKTVASQLKKSGFVPEYTELSIDDKSEKDGIRLKGKIDRIDILSGEDVSKTYLRVVDYKSSGSKDFKPEELYEGVSLQLTLYMSRALKILKDKYENLTPGGMYYYHLVNPRIDIKPDDGDVPDGDIKTKKEKELILSGLTLNCEDTGVISGIGKNTDGTSSVCNGVKIKNGEPADHDRLLNLDDMMKILDYTDDKTKSLTDDIYSGNIKTTPKGENACAFCEYKDVCGFDKRLAGCSIKKINSMTVRELNEKIDEEKNPGKEDRADE